MNLGKLIPESWKIIFPEIFQVWNVPCAVMVSLALQILMIFFAPLRKRSARYLTNVTIWSAYLMADWTAIYAISSIVNSARTRCEDDYDHGDAISALWANFMLLHLGGTDSITSYSFEDNEMWIRHTFRLFAVMYTVAYVCYMAQRRNPMDPTIWLVILIVFLAGAIKYLERILSLFRTRSGILNDSIRPKPIPSPSNEDVVVRLNQSPARTTEDIAVEVEPKRNEGNTSTAARDLVSSERSVGNATRDLQPIEVIREGYRFYKIFRVLIIVDENFKFRESKPSQDFFLGLQPNDAFEVMEVELNFMYDELFTKIATLNRNWRSYIVRFVCTALIIVALPILIRFNPIFHLLTQNIQTLRFNLLIHNLRITYALIVGAMALELIALIKLIFSDWTIAFLKHPKLAYLIHAGHRWTSSRARWSGSVSQLNLIDYSLKRNNTLLISMINRLGLKSIYDELTHKEPKHLDDEDCRLKEFIFKELKEKAEIRRGTSTANDICYSSHLERRLRLVKYSVTEADFDERVLLWHVATDLLHSTCGEQYNSTTTNHHRSICKILSDYILYLVVLRSKMLSAVVDISQIRFRETCAQAEKCFNVRKQIYKHDEACEKLLSMDSIALKSDSSNSNSVLYDACLLAHDLRTIYNWDDMWYMMSGVWLEMICYGASHCTGSEHGARLSRGGEMITFVWLLMAHFGLGDHFKNEPGKPAPAPAQDQAHPENITRPPSMMMGTFK